MYVSRIVFHNILITLNLQSPSDELAKAFRSELLVVNWLIGLSGVQSLEAIIEVLTLILNKLDLSKYIVVTSGDFNVHVNDPRATEACECLIL